MPNKAIIGTLFTPRHFGVAAPLYTKALLHKQCPIWRRYTEINRLTFSWLYGKHRYVRVFQLLRRLQ